MKKGKQDNDLASDPRKEIFENRILLFFFLSSFFFKHEREYGIFVYPALSHPPTVCRPNFFFTESPKVNIPPSIVQWERDKKHYPSRFVSTR